VSAYQKVGTFRVQNGQKQGGNVATYFCAPDGGVLHVVLGPADAATLLREARWAVETSKMAQLRFQLNQAGQRRYFAQAHQDRLRDEHRFDLKHRRLPRNLSAEVFVRRAFERHDLPQPPSQSGKIHLLLALYPLVDIEQVYEGIFEKILGEKVSTLPVAQK
jgi:hypothetical protein